MGIQEESADVVPEVNTRCFYSAMSREANSKFGPPDGDQAQIKPGDNAPGVAPIKSLWTNQVSDDENRQNLTNKLMTKSVVENRQVCSRKSKSSFGRIQGTYEEGQPGLDSFLASEAIQVNGKWNPRTKNRQTLNKFGNLAQDDDGNRQNLTKNRQDDGFLAREAIQVNGDWIPMTKNRHNLDKFGKLVHVDGNHLTKMSNSNEGNQKGQVWSFKQVSPLMADLFGH